MFRNRVSGLFVGKVEGLLLKENIFDLNGWQLGYNEIDGGTASDPQPPSLFSHNVYISSDVKDMTVIDNISTRGASMGLKLVSPGNIENNLLVANSYGIGMNDGDQNDDPATDSGGDRLSLKDNVVLHPSDKNGVWIGARGWGLGFGEIDVADGALIEGNIEAHSTAVGSNRSLATETVSLVNTFAEGENIVYEYGDSPELRPDGWVYTDPSRDIFSYLQLHGLGNTLEDFYIGTPCPRT